MFGLGSILIQELGSSIEGSKNLMTQTNTPKYVEKVVIKVMHVDRTTKLFQTMTIMSLNMGNLNLEVSNLKNKLATEDKDKAIL